MSDELWPPDLIQAWFRDGSDQALKWTPLGADGTPAPLVMMRGGQLYVGSSDEPAPAQVRVYELLDEVSDLPPRWVYRHVGTLDA